MQRLRIPLRSLVQTARVTIQTGEGFVRVDDQAPAVVLIEHYYRTGSECDLYLDLLHELTHLRQLAAGQDLWDEARHYVDRPTEIEGYAVAVEEGLRLGMSESEIISHLSNPWMSDDDVRTLRENVERFLVLVPAFSIP
jgi:hypothetical protein